MFIYHGKNFTATATGQKLKTVTCDKCATLYYYQLSRTATGSASAPYHIGQDSARRRALFQANKKLAKRLQREVEMVPCPNCKWVNQKLITQYRKRKYQSCLWIANAILGLGLFVCAIVYFDYGMLFNQQAVGVPPQIMLIAGITLLLACFFMLLRWILRQRINPNRSADGHPRLPVGTPPALLEHADAAGTPTLAPVPSDLSNLQTDAQWATFRPGQLVFEPLCCQCLESAETVFGLPIPIDDKTLAVPLCLSCHEKIRRQWWLRNLAAIPIAFLVGWLLTLFLPAVDDLGRLFATLFAGGFLTLVAVIINDHHLRPYRLRTPDATRSIHQIRFQNPAYTAILIRKIGQQDGLFQG